MSKFIVDIELGNDAMQTGRDVAEALARVQHHIEDNLLVLAEHNVGYSAAIRDGNGNTVGHFGVIGDQS